MDPLKLKVNLTTAFMLPMLYDQSFKHSDILTNTFIDTYIADLDKPENDNKLVVRYATITDLPSWTDTYSLYTSEDESMMVIYEVPEIYMDEYGKFLIGDYSKFSKKYKEQILKFWEADKYTFIYGVLYKHKDELNNFMMETLDIDLDFISVDAEYWKPPNLKQEIFGMKGD